MNEYLTKFKRLANRIIGLAPPALLNCFISGLHPELRREVQALQPHSLLQAVALAKLQEEKLHDRCRYVRPPAPVAILAPSLGPPTTNPRSPVKRLSPEELATRRDKGLCYHCEDKWVVSHRCRPLLHLLIADDETDNPDTSAPPSSPIVREHLSPDDPPNVSHIRLNALSGMPVPKTFRIYGTIAHHQVVILVDGGSTHNFIQPRLSTFLHLTHLPASAMRVMIGNGSTIACDIKCPDVPLLLQGHFFSVDLYQFPIGGADIVLGVQWLKLIGPVTIDYTSLTMCFTYLGQPITLNVDVPLCPSPASTQQLKRIAQTLGIAALYQLTHTPTRTTITLWTPPQL